MATAVKKAKTKLSGAKYIRTDLSIMLPLYILIRDCIDGEPAIKGFVSTVATSGNPTANNGGGIGAFETNIVLNRAMRYLPQPNAADQSEENRHRYAAYVTRAVFYNVTARTLEGMVGQIFLIDPVQKIPVSLDVVVKNADGQGVNLIQLAKRAVRYTMAFGRAGILADYPATEAPATKKQLADGDIQPVLRVYPPWDIINWQTEKRGAKTVLTLVVLRESIDGLADDGFTQQSAEQYRCLRLDDETGFYTVCIHSYQGNDYVEGEEITPKDASGKPLTDIPFTFIGAENNDAAVDKAPLYDLASLNIAHYRNSADYEESSFVVGQPTPWASGLTEEWVKTVLKGSLTLGSRGGIPLPVNASVGLLQANPNAMPLEAMHHKEDQMVAIGAKLVIQKRVQKTATEAIVDSSSESSVLTNVAKNVSSAFEFALAAALRFLESAADPNIQYQLNTEFELNRMTSDDQSKLVADWQKGAITFGEMRAALRKSGVATLSDAEAITAIQHEQSTMITLGPVVNPFNNTPEPAPAANPNVNPTGHARNPAARGQ